MNRKTEKAIREARRQLPGLRHTDSHIGRVFDEYVGPLLAHVDYLTALCLDAYDQLTGCVGGETPLMRRLLAVKPGTAINPGARRGFDPRRAVWLIYQSKSGRKSLWHLAADKHAGRTECGKAIESAVSVLPARAATSQDVTCGTCLGILNAGRE